jgi:hypothetical protein
MLGLPPQKKRRNCSRNLSGLVERSAFPSKHLCQQTVLKGKGVPLHAMKAPGGRGGKAPTHSQPRHRMGVSGQRHALAALYPREKDPRYPLDRRLGGPQSRSGRRD